VATEVGLSRAAIILRFTSTQALKVKVLSRLVERFSAAIEALPQTSGGDSLLQLAAFLGTHVGTREGSARFFANFTSNLQERALVQLEVRRGAALAAAISRAMPKVGIEHESAVIAFRAHLTGSIFTWLSLKDPDARRYLVLRTQEWLRLAGITFNGRLVEGLIGQPRSDAKRESAAGVPEKVTDLVKQTRKRR
jgi:TetR/AcrR family macrolide resistance operon transcriptional repressor